VGFEVDKGEVAPVNGRSNYSGCSKVDSNSHTLKFTKWSPQRGRTFRAAFPQALITTVVFADGFLKAAKARA
jgi:hypothetical protein